jgi:hypothetical protein
LICFVCYRTITVTVRCGFHNEIVARAKSD